MDEDHLAESTAPLLPTSEASPASSLEINDVASKPRPLPTICIIVTPIVILIPLLFLLALLLPHPQDKEAQGPPKETKVPQRPHEPAASTVLQFVTERGDLVDPRNSRLYEQLRNGVFYVMYPDADNANGGPYSSDDGSGEQPNDPCGVPIDPSPFRLEVSHESVEFGQELHISWHENDNNEASIEDQDIILALSCGDTNSVMIGENLVDAATLTQVKATHAYSYHNQVKSNENEANLNNEWIIPKFPAIYSNQCLFTMLMQSPRWYKYRKDYPVKTVLYDILSQKRIDLSSSQEQPTQIHLGLSSDPNARYIQFTTGLPGGSVVEIAKRPADSEAELTFVKLTGSSTSYSAQDMCQSPANTVDNAGVGFSNPGQLHVVKAEGLEDDSNYVYRVGLAMGQGVRWSNYFEFQTFPSAKEDELLDGSKAVTTFLAVADQGVMQSLDSNTPATAPSTMLRDLEYDVELRHGKEAAQDVADLITTIIRNETISAIHHPGDLSYANGAGHAWDRYMVMIQPYASRVPVTVGVGNHEYDHTQGGVGKDPSGAISDGGFQPYWGNFDEASGGECGVPVSKRFAGPENGNGVFWYSFNQPLVHIIMLSTEHNMTVNSPQYKWLRTDLESVNRTVTPWLIVEMHRPMYDKYAEGDAVTVALQYEVEDLFYLNNVDLVISGHVHSYLRTCDGLFRGKCDSGGPMHVSVGTGGAPLDGGHANIPWVEKYDGDHWGVGKASVLNASSLKWEFIAVGGEVTDEYMISRDRK